MNRSNKKLCLIQIIYTKAIARTIESKFKQFCCGCKEYDQDCLMLDESEKWQMYGLDAIEETKTNHTVWHKLTNVIKIINVPFEKRLTDHISNLEENSNLMLIESLLQVYQENQPLVKVLCDLSDWDPQTDPLANFAQCLFSFPPKFVYYVKGKDEKFESHETEPKRTKIISMINFKNFLINCK